MGCPVNFLQSFVQQRMPLSTACLTVEDQGNGNLSSQLERLFAPFIQLDGTQTEKVYDLNLLSAVRIVEAHGGKVNMQGSPQQGTTIEACFNLCGEGE